MKSLFFIFYIYILCMNCQQKTLTKEQKDREDLSSAPEKIGCIVFIVNSEGCHCVKVKCEEVNKELLDNLSSKSYIKDLFEFKKIDYSKEHEKAEEFYINYDIGYIPVVLLLDREGKPYYLSSYDFDNTEFLKALDSLVSIVNLESKKE